MYTYIYIHIDIYTYILVLTDVEDVDHRWHRHNLVQDDFKSESSSSCAHEGPVQPVVPKITAQSGQAALRDSKDLLALL